MTGDFIFINTIYTSVAKGTHDLMENRTTNIVIAHTVMILLCHFVLASTVESKSELLTKCKLAAA